MPEQALPFPLPVVPPKFTPENVGAQNRKLAQQLYAQFFSWPIERSRKILETTPAEVWEREGQKRALKVFHAAAERVPAYKDFLKKHRVQHEKVRMIMDFKKVVPVMDKENYLRKYELPDLCWDGVLASTQITSVSSGSTGEPFFWPRGALLEVETTFLFELILSRFFKARAEPTLFVNSQTMGMYIGGPFTLNALLRIAQKGWPITVVTPGITLEDALQVLTRLRSLYRRIILAAYPPFAKDILDAGIARGIHWSAVPMKLMLFGEGFSETWRDYVAELSGARSAAEDFINCYGTADAAILAHETPYSVLLRRIFAANAPLSQKVFSDERLPSLMQYYPTFRYFELLDGELGFTFGTGGIPLVRYNIHDRGGFLSASSSKVLWRENGGTEKSAATINLPLLYLLGRANFTTTLYGLNIYPENIKAALERAEIQKLVTGKFQMSTEYRRRNQNQYLLINIELARRTRPSTRLRREVRRVIVDTLKRVNAEYRKLHESVGRRAVPEIRVRAWGDLRYFTVGTKQKWVRRK